MTRASNLTSRERIGAGFCSAALVAALGWALVVGLGVKLPGTAEEGLELFAVTPAPPPPPERVEPVRKRSERAEGEAAPPNLRSRATDVVAPPPVVVLPVPVTVMAAPVANAGTEATQGVADVPGPGTGAGGLGSGFGGGGRGDGTGGGYADETPPRRVRGRLSSSMIPDRLRERPGFRRYTVGLRYRVEADGRVTGCQVTRSSGEADLDANTCRGVTERFRYKPALDAEGRAIRSVVVIDWDWDVEGPDPAE